MSNDPQDSKKLNPDLAGAAAALDALTGEVPGGSSPPPAGAASGGPEPSFEIPGGEAPSDAAFDAGSESAGEDAESLSGPELTAGAEGEADASFGESATEEEPAVAGESDAKKAKAEAEPAPDAPLPPPPPQKQSFFRPFQSIKVMYGFSRDVLAELRSTDLKSRQMAVIFTLSALGTLTTLGLMYQRFFGTPAAPAVSPVEEFVDDQVQSHHMPGTMLKLGIFDIEIKDSTRPARMPQGWGTAEILIVIECGSKETCDYIQDYIQKARDEITTVLTVMERQELLSPEGKARLKKQLLDRLNGWLKRGKVENMYFTRLVIS